MRTCISELRVTCPLVDQLTVSNQLDIDGVRSAISELRLLIKVLQYSQLTERMFTQPVTHHAVASRDWKL